MPDIALTDGQTSLRQRVTDNGDGTFTPQVNAISGAGAPTVPTAVSRIPTSAASVNGTVAKASAGYLFGVSAFNASGLGKWLKIYNKATAPGGGDTPIISIYLPPNTGFSKSFGGLAFAAGIAYQLVLNAIDNDATAIAAGDVLGVNVEYA